jgi:hypothetical protein
MMQVKYYVISTIPWAEPYTHGQIPIITACTNTVDAPQLTRLSDEFWRIHTNPINMDLSLKRIVLEAYGNVYTSQLEDYLLQYANCSALYILMHFKKTYGFINPTQLADNYNKMTASINFQDPIETLFTQIEDGVRYANTGMQ